MSQAFWRVEKLLEASGHAFLPPPRVASRVVVFTKKPPMVVERRKFLKFVKAGYAQRRKLLISNLTHGMNLEASRITEAFEILKIGPKVRAEELSVQQMVDLFKVLGYDKS
jgi:16S rRNA (adenine1518-N6/adenine1519-N6)-dimethyltransferase